MYSENHSDSINSENCKKDECIPFEQVIKVRKLAEAYVPFQKFCSLFEPQESLIKGTVFPALSEPYEKKSSGCKKCKSILNF